MLSSQPTVATKHLSLFLFFSVMVSKQKFVYYFLCFLLVTSINAVSASSYYFECVRACNEGNMRRFCTEIWPEPECFAVIRASRERCLAYCNASFGN